MNLNEALEALESLGNEKVRAQNRRKGAGEEQFGVRLGDIRKLARAIKANHALAIALWETANSDARLLAILLLDPSSLSSSELDRWVRSATSVQVADWLNAYVCKKHPDRDALRTAWLSDDDPWAARAGWSLTAERIAKKPAGLDTAALLSRIEYEMADAPPDVQWTMNSCLAAIGIHFPENRDRAIAIGERLGVYRDYPVAKGCTSPFAPVWINEMASRQGAK